MRTRAATLALLMAGWLGLAERPAHAQTLIEVFAPACEEDDDDEDGDTCPTWTWSPDEEDDSGVEPIILLYEIDSAAQVQDYLTNSPDLDPSIAAGLNKAVGYQLTDVPAVVIDGSNVVYNPDSVMEAVADGGEALDNPLTVPDTTLSVADSITTIGILAQSASLSCTDWRITGTCQWLDCGFFGCSVKISPHISHFNPTHVVTAYDTAGESPWTEMRIAFGAIQVAAHKASMSLLGSVPTTVSDGGRQVDARAGRRDEHMHFMEAEAYGHPGLPLSALNLFGLGLFCPRTDVQAFYPYFQSGINSAEWRTGIGELIYAATYVPGHREVGSWPLNSWGSIHPRIGFLNQPEEPKAAAVIAQRVGDIIYRSDQPHIYTKVGAVGGEGSGGMKVWTPSAPLEEGNSDNHKWQMLTPVGSGCEVFGGNDTGSLNSWSDNKIADSGSYAWNLWREYDCCKDRGIFLFRIVF